MKNVLSQPNFKKYSFEPICQSHSVPLHFADEMKVKISLEMEEKHLNILEVLYVICYFY